MWDSRAAWTDHHCGDDFVFQDLAIVETLLHRVLPKIVYLAFEFSKKDYLIYVDISNLLCLCLGGIQGVWPSFCYCFLGLETWIVWDRMRISSVENGVRGGAGVVVFLSCAKDCSFFDEQFSGRFRHSVVGSWSKRSNWSGYLFYWALHSCLTIGLIGISFFQLRG